MKINNKMVAIVPSNGDNTFRDGESQGGESRFSPFIPSISFANARDILRKRFTLSLAGIAASAILIAGCTQTAPRQEVNLHYVPANKVPAEANNQDAQLQIAEAASSVGKSLQQLSAMQMAVAPKVEVPDIDPKTTGMTQVASLDWYGPVLPLLEQIGKATGYQVKVLGNEPAIPIIISMSVNSQVMADILRNVAYQAHNKAMISVNPAKRTIELQYIRV